VGQRSSFSSIHKKLTWFAVLALPLVANAQQPKSSASPPGGGAPNITDAWSGLLQGAIPAATPDPTVSVAQQPVKKGPVDDFENHFFMDLRTEYWREASYFTGNPTATGVINAPYTGTFNPAGIPDPAAFQPSTSRIYSYLDTGTRGWLSDRVDTHFLVRYRQDLTHVDPGSPQLSVLETFGADRRFEFLTGSVQINGKPTDGFFANSNIVIGRQEVYGAEVAAFDGVSYNVNQKSFGITLYGGRRFTLFSDPQQRAIGGGNFVWKFADASSLEYDATFYIKGTHVIAYRRHLTPGWLVSATYRMLGGSPTDFTANGFWSPSNGRNSIRLSFWQKLSNKDFFYDYTLNARDLDPYNPLARLYLGPQSQYSQFVIDGRRTITPWLRLGGAITVRKLNDFSHDSSAFDTSFEDYRANMQFYPFRRIETFWEYHERDSDRLPVFNQTDPFNTSFVGETKTQDFSLEIGRTFFEGGRLQLRAGGFYRRINYRDYFFIENNLHDRGLLARGTVKVDDHTRVYVDWDLDTDFFLFRPDLKNSQILRIGVDWRY
jgi:hypothetical protein